MSWNSLGCLLWDLIMKFRKCLMCLLDFQVGSIQTLQEKEAGITGY